MGNMFAKITICQESFNRISMFFLLPLLYSFIQQLLIVDFRDIMAHNCVNIPALWELIVCDSLSLYE